MVPEDLKDQRRFMDAMADINRRLAADNISIPHRSLYACRLFSLEAKVDVDIVIGSALGNEINNWFSLMYGARMRGPSVWAGQ